MIDIILFICVTMATENFCMDKDPAVLCATNTERIQHPCPKELAVDRPGLY